MKKKEYERPTTQVVQLKGQQQLLAGSGRDIPNNDPYTPGSDPFSY